MDHFTIQELNLICIYDTGTRTGLITEIKEMIAHLMPEEMELRTLSVSVVDKLGRMTDEEYDALTCNSYFIFDEEDQPFNATR